MRSGSSEMGSSSCDRAVTHQRVPSAATSARCIDAERGRAALALWLAGVISCVAFLRSWFVLPVPARCESRQQRAAFRGGRRDSRTRRTPHIGGMLGRIRRSASFGRAGSSSSDRAPRIDRSASLLSAHELDLLPGPAAARLPPTSSSTLLPSPRPRLAPLQGMLLKRHRSSKWTKWGRRPC